MEGQEVKAQSVAREPVLGDSTAQCQGTTSEYTVTKVEQNGALRADGATLQGSAHVLGAVEKLQLAHSVLQMSAHVRFLVALRHYVCCKHGIVCSILR